MSIIKNTTIIDKYSSAAHLSYYAKKNKFFVKDGWITYKLTLTPNIKCQCGSENNLCIHVLHILITKYNIDLNILKFFHKLSHHIPDVISKEQNVNDELIKIINFSIINDSCGICLEPMTTESLFSQSLHECIMCQKYAHSKCIHKWKTKDVSRGCIYCRC